MITEIGCMSAATDTATMLIEQPPKELLLELPTGRPSSCMKRVKLYEPDDDPVAREARIA
ncbi:hypothetical protein [Streptomyces scabiei]|uniref:hypothetical protein n=1 Tax=Streptomyces scabiei TaxID=1930 RepID=UPI0029BB5E85|nr:hypothetical protein [Streptomyces scabiei]MDX2993535.1 hypothetical protein [Streptomyces scabiei]MDX3028360.1 hypothetical protein [Streptomyces scabiei]